MKAKLADEGPGFVEDNRDVFELVIKPYIFLGFIQHLFYWNNNPNDPWYWESEKVVDWITALAQSEKDGETIPAAPASRSGTTEGPAPDRSGLLVSSLVTTRRP